MQMFVFASTGVLCFLLTLSACDHAKREPISPSFSDDLALRAPAAPFNLQRTSATPPMVESANRSDAGATLSVLKAGLDDKDYGTRLVATEALGCVSAPEALGWLERQLGDPEEDVRAAAILSLAQRRTQTAQRLLRSVQNDEKEQLALRVLAAAALVSPAMRCDTR